MILCAFVIAAVGGLGYAYGLGASLFFIGYFLFEVPSNIFLERFGAPRWFARIMLTWGAVTISYPCPARKKGSRPQPRCVAGNGHDAGISPVFHDKARMAMQHRALRAQHEPQKRRRSDQARHDAERHLGAGRQRARERIWGERVGPGWGQRLS